MRYLTNKDYINIQDIQLQQIIQGDQNRLLQAESIGIEEISSYLLQRFDVKYEFTDTPAWNAHITYEPHDRVIIDYGLFQNGHEYQFGDCVIYNGSGYVAKHHIPFSSPGPFNPSDWTYLGARYQFYNAKYPFPMFNNNNYYKLGDKVYWKGFVYTCTSATVPLNSDTIIQYFVYSNVPNLNIFPDDSVNNDNGQYWGFKTAYDVPSYVASPVGPATTDTTYWDASDNRCHQIVMYLTDIVVYYLHRSIAPNNIPELRLKAYEYAVSWLKMVAKGTVTPNLAQLQPNQGLKYRFGGSVKRGNAY